MGSFPQNIIALSDENSFDMRWATQFQSPHSRHPLPGKVVSPRCTGTIAYRNLHKNSLLHDLEYR
jgi:hypothetical protein